MLLRFLRATKNLLELYFYSCSLYYWVKKFFSYFKLRDGWESFLKMLLSVNLNRYIKPIHVGLVPLHVTVLVCVTRKCTTKFASYVAVLVPKNFRCSHVLTQVLIMYFIFLNVSYSWNQKTQICCVSRFLWNA